MKNKSTLQPAPAHPNLVRRPATEGGFFNLRGLIGLFLCCTGVLIAFFAFGAPTGPFQPQPQERRGNQTTLVATPLVWPTLWEALQPALGNMTLW